MVRSWVRLGRGRTMPENIVPIFHTRSTETQYDVIGAYSGPCHIHQAQLNG